MGSLNRIVIDRKFRTWENPRSGISIFLSPPPSIFKFGNSFFCSLVPRLIGLVLLWVLLGRHISIYLVVSNAAFVTGSR